jgi:hypothetical protein
MNFSSVFTPVIRCINHIQARALHRREFRQFFLTNSNEGEEQRELLLHCTVRWLSRGQALERYWNLRNSVLGYLEESDQHPDECSFPRKI